MRHSTLYLAGLLLTATGCKVFDPALYKEAEMGADAAVNPGTDAAPGGQTLALGERCIGAPLVASSGTAFNIDTTRLTSDFKDVMCAGAEMLGNDGFVTVDMKKGEKWHVHVATNDPTANPAVYVLPESCDERACDQGWGIDQCGPGKPEHLTFFAPESRRYVFGVDSRQAGGAAYTIIVIKPTCGNGSQEHSETCDDGNTASGDGCDMLCRREIQFDPANSMVMENAREAEPNDDVLAGNMVMTAASANSVNALGSVAPNRCDVDLYGVQVPAAGNMVEAKVVTAQNTTCPAGTGEVLKLDLLRQTSSGLELQASGTVPTGEGCPAIPKMTIPTAGTYFFRVTNTSADLTIDYRVRISRQ